MPTTIFSLAAVERLRQASAQARRLQGTNPDGWSKSTVDPNGVAAVFDSLRVKSGFTLRAYQFQAGGDGWGVVWAMPSHLGFVEPDRCIWLNKRPRPPGALDHVMEAVEGDGSAWSYMSASVLWRELAELGAKWHGTQWDTHSLLDREPPLDRFPISPERKFTQPSEWRWELPRPQEWQPLVSEPTQNVQVTFHTMSRLHQETIFRHTDTYRRGFYVPQSDLQHLAFGNHGIMF